MTVLFFSVILTLLQCHDTTLISNKPLDAARQKLSTYHAFSYEYTSYIPDVAGVIDAQPGSCSFIKASSSPIGYDFVIKSPGRDEVLINGDFKQVIYAEKKVVSLSEQMRKVVAAGFIPVRFSPIIHLKKNLSFSKDTVMAKQRYSKYKFVEMDSVIRGERVLMEENVFINNTESVVSRYERVTFVGAKVSGRVVFEYENYNFDNNTTSLNYTFPEGFVTELFNQQSGLHLLKEGENAPLFSKNDILGNTISLDELKGKKILLDFSVIGCGYCKRAVDHLTNPAFQLKDEIVVIYVDPIDKQAALESYAKKSKITFPVVADAAEVGQSYGVSAYPTFYLINERGVIEKTIVGYKKDFIDGLGK